MKKQVTLTTKGHRADVGPYKVNRILPNRYVEAVGPFVFLDHMMPEKHSLNEERHEVNGTGAHPHRGIATLTYVINGEADHNDSKGHHALVRSGGAQWMKAGNGIVHDESFNVDVTTGDLLTHGMQFWINLPAKNKAEKADYLPVQANEIPKKNLAGNGWIKVIVGEYEDLASKIPNYSKQFIYHIHIEPGKKFSLETEDRLEYAAFLPFTDAKINGDEYKQGDFIAFDNKEGMIEFTGSNESTDVILFGGEHYNEPIVAAGPFVMNTEHEISEAYNDFYKGKYGEIEYEKSNNYK
jgi:redox-sensitive bicupin YhaK (pirin superfamily)